MKKSWILSPKIQNSAVDKCFSFDGATNMILNERELFYIYGKEFKSNTFKLVK